MSSSVVMSSVCSQARRTHAQEHDRLQDHTGNIFVKDDDNIIAVYTTWHYQVTRLDCITGLKD